MDERLAELKKEVSIKGFRPGKVPSSVIKNQFGKSIYGEVIDKILRETSTKAFEVEALVQRPMGELVEAQIARAVEVDGCELRIRVGDLHALRLAPLLDLRDETRELIGANPPVAELAA